MEEVMLSSLLPGESGKVAGIKKTSTSVRQRLLEMGLTKGTVVRMIRFAPFGDPIEIQAKGFRLSLRKLEAEAIMITPEP
jgi:Fe2+ transport system protein FeoA